MGIGSEEGFKFQGIYAKSQHYKSQATGNCLDLKKRIMHIKAADALVVIAGALVSASRVLNITLY
jgi:hypothetical protein